MINEAWQEIPDQNIDSLSAFKLTTDAERRELGRHILHTLNLERAGYSFEGPFAEFEDFKDGQIVKLQPLDPRKVHVNMESFPLWEQYWEILGQRRWFTSSGFVLNLTGITSTGCYGIDRTSYRLTVFDC